MAGPLSTAEIVHFKAEGFVVLRHVRAACGCVCAVFAFAFSNTSPSAGGQPRPAAKQKNPP
jgi:hypothetical protein